jgi:hypothetical protein
LRRSVGPGKHLRWNTERVLRSSPSYRLRATSCVTPLSALLRHNIYLRGCDTRPSDILRWPRSLPHFRLWCPLPWSRCSPGNTAHVEVVNKLVAKFQKVETCSSKLKWPTVRICDLLLGPPPGWAWLADCLDEATAWLKVEKDTRRKVEAYIGWSRSCVPILRWSCKL